MLTLAERTGALDGDGPGEEHIVDEPADRALARRAAAEAMVLLRNEAPTVAAAEPAAAAAEPILPLAPAALRRVAVIGPNAARLTREGGGSAHVEPVHTSHPLDALTERLAPFDIEVRHHPGCAIHKRLPPLERAGCGPITVAYHRDPGAVALDRPADNAAAPAPAPERTAPSATTRLTWFEDPLGADGEAAFGARLRTTLPIDRTGTWTFGLAAVGDAVLDIDGVTVIDNRSQPIGGGFFGFGKGELTAEVSLEAGRTVRIEARLQRPVIHNAVSGLQIGAYGPELRDPVADAVDVAAGCDVAIVVVGTNDEWESEGWDRDSLHLPGRQDELISRVAEACPRTVVVLNSGSPVAMPWRDEVPAVVMAWFPGQEGGDALTDILLGTVEPSGRLPVSFPQLLEDTPAVEHHPGRNGVAAYTERRLVGHRWYGTVGRDPLFPFGFGLGYARLELVDAGVVAPHRVRVRVHNPSDRNGCEVIQVYVHADDRSALAADHPDQVLAGFAKVAVAAGATEDVEVDLDPRSFTTWDADRHGWVPAGARFELRVGRSSSDVAHRLVVADPAGPAVQG
ncbi:MAG: glycoside hydrolase family 3 C-terminal domain-containing protein [Acidimicrobiales bacterium]